MKIAISILVLLIAGCTAPPVRSRVEPVALPDGTQGFAVHCHRGIARCMNAAAEVCAGPYHVLDSEGRTSGTVAVPMANGVIAVNASRHTLIVECAH